MVREVLQAYSMRLTVCGHSTISISVLCAYRRSCNLFPRVAHRRTDACLRGDRWIRSACGPLPQRNMRDGLEKEFLYGQESSFVSEVARLFDERMDGSDLCHRLLAGLVVGHHDFESLDRLRQGFRGSY